MAFKRAKKVSIAALKYLKIEDVKEPSQPNSLSY
jgi:hypothetical protein